jgi:hypothetical protein
MNLLKDQIVQTIGNNAAQRVSILAGQFTRSVPEEKEAILAGLEFERWLAESCEECRN